MPDYAGPLQRLVLSRTLWLILVWPLLGAAWQALVERRRLAADPRHDVAAARATALASLTLTATATFAHLAVLARVPRAQRALFQALTANAHVGQVDVTLALMFDPLTAAGGVLACGVALAAALLLPPRLAREHGWRVWAWIHVALFGALLSFLADGFVTTAMGWSVAVASAAWLAGWKNAAAGIVVAMRGVLAIAAMLVGAAVLFWGLGGEWEGDDFVVDVQPRFAAVRVGEWSAEASVVTPVAHTVTADDASETAPGGTVTLTSTPGALVYVDEARRRSLQSPFVRVPVLGGNHAFRIHRGEGTEDAVVGGVAFEGGEEIALAPVGSALAFRTIADQLLLRDRHGDAVLRSALEMRQAPGGITVVGAAFLAWIVAALALSGWPPPPGAPRALVAVACSATLGPLGPYFLARVASLGTLEPHPDAPIAAVGIAVLLFGVMRAFRTRGWPQRVLAVMGVAPAGFDCVALGVFEGQWFREAMMAAGFLAAGVGLFTTRQRRATSTTGVGTAGAGAAQDEGVARVEGIEEALLVGVPEGLGALVVSMERWVVNAVAGAVATLSVAAAWTAATADRHVVSVPAEVLAARLLRFRRRVEPIAGVSLASLLWVLVGAAGLAVLVHALWPSG